MIDDEFEHRIQFDDEDEIMEVDFSGIDFNDPDKVHAFYDAVDRKIAQTGKNWFFLINYKNCRIDPKAWVAFAHRGKLVNLAHSLGSVRYMAPDQSKGSGRSRSMQAQFEDSLFESKDAALKRLQQMGARKNH